MSNVKLYIEFHWAKRRPNLKYFLNKTEITPQSITVIENFPYRENIVVDLICNIDKNNLLEVSMSDKVDDDLLFVNNSEFIDHWVKIRNVEIDNIKLNTVMYRCCKFVHNMSPDWLNKMSRQGYNILDVYESGTDIRLNGTWYLNFDTPIWEWCTKNIK